MDVVLDPPPSRDQHETVAHFHQVQDSDHKTPDCRPSLPGADPLPHYLIVATVQHDAALPAFPHMTRESEERQHLGHMDGHLIVVGAPLDPDGHTFGRHPHHQPVAPPERSDANKIRIYSRGRIYSHFVE